MDSWASFSIGLAAGSWLSVLLSVTVTWWRKGRYQEPKRKNDSEEETIMGEGRHLEP